MSEVRTKLEWERIDEKGEKGAPDWGRGGRGEVFHVTDFQRGREYVEDNHSRGPSKTKCGSPGRGVLNRGDKRGDGKK